MGSKRLPIAKIVNDVTKNGKEEVNRNVIDLAENEVVVGSTKGVRRKAKEATKTTAEVTKKVPKRVAKKDKAALDDEVSSDGAGCIEVMLAHNYDPDKHDPTGWLMSEKLDGVRCYWNGKTMYSRAGNKFHAPDDFKAKLPKIELDGELWTNRDDF